MMPFKPIKKINKFPARRSFRSPRITPEQLERIKAGSEPVPTNTIFKPINLKKIKFPKE